jgi:GT2 family glycosyltransferase
MTRISIIIVSFNGLTETTQPCLESIFEHAKALEYEVIVVDNHSEDGTAEFLKRTATRQPRLRWILNASNLGFAAANNVGLAAARGDCLVLLNSDTVITAGSLERLAQFLEAHHNVGLAGPVTNAAGNEQVIFTESGTVKAIIEQGRKWTANSPGDYFETERLGFFCVAMRGDHFKRVGPLDEAFGLGFYEDDDYCLRSRQAGFRLVCVEDAFVYHRGSQSFKRQPDASLTALMRKNRKLLERKHGLRYRPIRTCELQLRLARHCLDQAKDPTGSRWLAKAANRLAAARACQPKSRLKRAWFSLRCDLLQRRLSRLDEMPQASHAPSESSRTDHQVLF